MEKTLTSTQQVAELVKALSGLKIPPGKLRQGCVSAARNDGKPMTEEDWDLAYTSLKGPLPLPQEPLGVCTCKAEKSHAPGCPRQGVKCL